MSSEADNVIQCPRTLLKNTPLPSRLVRRFVGHQLEKCNSQGENVTLGRPYVVGICLWRSVARSATCLTRPSCSHCHTKINNCNMWIFQVGGPQHDVFSFQVTMHDAAHMHVGQPFQA